MRCGYNIFVLGYELKWVASQLAMIILVITLLILIYFIIETIYSDYFKYKRANLKEVDRIEDFVSTRHKEILELSSRLHSHFDCRICHSTRADCNVVSFSGKEYSQISKKRPHKFIKRTCMGCGISNFFNLNQMWSLDGFDPLPIDDPKYDFFTNLTQRHPCPDCKNEHTLSKILTVRKKGLRYRLRPQPSEIVCLSCSQCHFSFFYDAELARGHYTHA